MQTGLRLSKLLKLCCRTSSLPQRLKTWTILQRKPFLILIPLQCMNLQIYFSLKIQHSDLAVPTHQKFCFLCGFQRKLLTHIPPQKIKFVQTITFSLVYFTQITPHLLTMKTLPKCFNQVNKLWKWKETILCIIYFIKYYRGGFGKIWIRKLIYVIFHIFYHSLFCLSCP